LRSIELAARENDHAVVTIYPNKAQFAPGTRYVYDLERDIRFAFDHGATHVISSHDGEMYPETYRTFLDQGPSYSRLDGTVVPFLFRGMITQCVRWISFVRPHTTYWGLKDIGQTVLVERAVADLLIDTEVREVPCIRFKSGMPISSRLLSLDRESLREVAHVYKAVELGRRAVAAGERRSERIVELVRAELERLPLSLFRICYVKLAEPQDFLEPAEVTLPFILHVVVTNGTINHFDGLFIRDEKELLDGPDVLWLEEEWPTDR
jgi:pantoate--beta-alanine ligase